MVLENLKKFIDSKGISVSAFEKSIGMSNNSFRKSLNSGGHIGSDKLENILKIYPELNPVWLLQGEGEMLKEYGGTSNLCRVTSVSIDEESFIYKMYKEKDIEVGQLKEEIGVLKTRIQQLEADNESLRNQAGVDRVYRYFYQSTISRLRRRLSARRATFKFQTSVSRKSVTFLWVIIEKLGKRNN